MEALSSARGRDDRHKRDGILPSLAAPIRYLRAIIRGLSVPRGAHPSQMASREMLERFEVMLRCGF